MKQLRFEALLKRYIELRADLGVALRERDYDLVRQVQAQLCVIEPAIRKRHVDPALLRRAAY